MTQTDRLDAEQLCAVSCETWDKLEVMVDLLKRWQKTINLVAPSSLSTIWTRHVADSLQLLKHYEGKSRWVDLGSGAGFPGLVIAIASAGTPGKHIDLIESDARKCAFLREVIRVTGAPASVHNNRIEKCLVDWPETVDIVAARALAPLDQLLRLSFPLLKKGAYGLFPKGQDVELELTQASKSWIIDADLEQSVTEPSARIVVVRRLQPRD